MAPWTSRTLSQSPVQPAASRAVGGDRTPSRVAAPADLHPHDHPYDIPTLHATSERRGSNGGVGAGASHDHNHDHVHGDVDSNYLTVPSRKPSRHGRSMSHPFPYLFSSKKKRIGGDSAAAAGTSASNLEEAAGRFGGSTSAAMGFTAPPSRTPEKQLVTGRCMTCDTTVRWPKDLTVYRCTVCLTINDLKPYVRDAKPPPASRSPGKRPVPLDRHDHAVPLSIDRTRRIIDGCVAKFLTARLQLKGGGDMESPQPSPTRGDHFGGTEGLPYRAAPTSLYPDVSHTPGITIVNDNGHDSADGLERSQPIYSTSSPGDLGAHMIRHARSLESSHLRPPDRSPPPPPREGHHYTLSADGEYARRPESVKSVFKPLEDYIVESFGSLDCINASFATARPGMAPRSEGEGVRRSAAADSDRQASNNTEISELDAKTLLLGDVAENGTWWTGGREFLDTPSRAQAKRRNYSLDGTLDIRHIANAKPLRLNWTEMSEWYVTVLRAGNGWRRKLDEMIISDPEETYFKRLSAEELAEIESAIMDAQTHCQRVLLKATENLLKRPGRLLLDPEDARFLLIILGNPLLHPSRVQDSGARGRARSQTRDPRHKSRSRTPKPFTFQPQQLPARPKPSLAGSGPGQHSGITKRIVGLMSNLSNECHHHLVAWFTRLPEGHFRMIMELVSSFVTYRLSRQQKRKQANSVDPTAGLIPRMSANETGTSAALHAALGLTEQTAKKNKQKNKTLVYGDDWQIRASARVMALLFAANNSGIGRRNDIRTGPLEMARPHRERSLRHGQIIPTSDFYNSLLDLADLITDFDNWESKRAKFTFCQYPFFLSIWAKIQIMEYDARRQMEVKAREAFFDSIMTHKAFNQYLTFTIRRDCLVEDSLKSVSEVVGSGSEDIKKGLRIIFKGEEGIDAGGLRKEWFLLLVRDVFNPDHGMFVYDEDSRFCYFNPNSFETSDQFFLVGVVLGLAIYNSTILDVAFPPFAFRKLLASGPVTAAAASSHAKPSMTYTLDDLAEFRPALASGLRKLLEFDGDVEGTFCRNFVADVERYGQVTQTPLCKDGDNRVVTNHNRREFVDLYIRYLLDAAVSRQFEPFKRGFFTVCGGNALSLFRPEEIELLIRGSDEPLDISSLKAVAAYDNWGRANAAEHEPVIGWFWETFESASIQNQRKLLGFITGSDRIPAMGATNLVIKLTCLGDDTSRFPVARTCFNMLSLYRYKSKEGLETMLWRAVDESEGFGLK